MKGRIRDPGRYGGLTHFVDIFLLSPEISVVDLKIPVHSIWIRIQNYGPIWIRIHTFAFILSYIYMRGSNTDPDPQHLLSELFCMIA